MPVVDAMAFPPRRRPRALIAQAIQASTPAPREAPLEATCFAATVLFRVARV